MSISMMNQATITMGQLQNKIDVIGHNMANSATPGYKSRQAEFSSLLFQQINNLKHHEDNLPRLTPDGIRMGTGARLGAVTPNMTLGALKETDRDLDIALLNEKHFFRVGLPDRQGREIVYTRDGSFYLSPVNEGGNEVVIATKEGYPLVGVDNFPIVFDATNVEDIQIADDGAVRVKRGGEYEYVGTIMIAEIDNPRLLESAGNNNYQLPDLAELGLNFDDIVRGVPQVGGLMQANTLEMSNVNVGLEMTDLISAQRAYQFNARTITMADQMQGLVNQLK